MPVRPRLPTSHPQLAGRPVSELCRHLGLTSSALSASVTATPDTGTAHGKKATAAQPEPPNTRNPPNADKADKRGSCEQPAPGNLRPGGLSSSALCREAVENPYAARAPPAAPPAGEAGAGSSSSEQRQVGNPVEKSRPSPRAMTLLPRRRIFYSSTFVRWVPPHSEGVLPSFQISACELQCLSGFVVYRTGLRAPRLFSGSNVAQLYWIVGYLPCTAGVLSLS